MDDVDLATKHIEDEMAIRLKYRPTGRELPPMGACYYCGEKVDPPKIYCNDACGEDHEWILSREKLNRRV